jgi:hypothetical protein
MADKKISQLTGASTPLAGTEVLPIVQSGSTVKVSAADVTAGRAVSAASVAVTGSTAPANGVYLPAANSVGIATNSGERLRVNATGEVGVGTTTPRGDVDISSGSTTTSVTKSLHLGYSAANFYGFRVANTNAAGSFLAGTFSIQRGTGSAWSDALIVNDSGNVGISVGNAPTQVLNLYRTGSTQTVMAVGNSNTGLNGTYFGVDTAGNAIISQTQAFAMTFSVNGLPRLTISAAGNPSIGAGAVATTATDGFLYVPTCAGTPTGTPTTVTGFAPIVVNTTNNKLYFYSGGAWRDAGP